MLTGEEFMLSTNRTHIALSVSILALLASWRSLPSRVVPGRGALGELDGSHNLLHHSLADVLLWPIQRVAAHAPGEGSGQRCRVDCRRRARSRAYWARVRAAELRTLRLVSALAPG